MGGVLAGAKFPGGVVIPARAGPHLVWVPLGPGGLGVNSGGLTAGTSRATASRVGAQQLLAPKQRTMFASVSW